MRVKQRFFRVLFALLSFAFVSGLMIKDARAIGGVESEGKPAPDGCSCPCKGGGIFTDNCPGSNESVCVSRTCECLKLQKAKSFQFMTEEEPLTDGIVEDEVVMETLNCKWPKPPPPPAVCGECPNKGSEWTIIAQCGNPPAGKTCGNFRCAWVKTIPYNRANSDISKLKDNQKDSVQCKDA